MTSQNVLYDVSTSVGEFVMEVLPFLPAWRKYHKINYIKFELDFYFLFKSLQKWQNLLCVFFPCKFLFPLYLLFKSLCFYLNWFKLSPICMCFWFFFHTAIFPKKTMLISLLCIFHIDTACVISHAVFQQQPGNTTTEKFLRDGGLFLSLGKIWGETNQCDLAVPFFLLLFSLD